MGAEETEEGISQIMKGKANHVQKCFVQEVMHFKSLNSMARNMVSDNSRVVEWNAWRRHEWKKKIVKSCYKGPGENVDRADREPQTCCFGFSVSRS